MRVEYDSAGQRLLLFVPQAWVPARYTSFSEGGRRSEPKYGRGAVFNYDLYTSTTEHIGSQAALWNEFRFFSGNAVLSSTGALRQTLSGSLRQREGYMRYDTSLMFNNEEDATQWKWGM